MKHLFIWTHLVSLKMFFKFFFLLTTDSVTLWMFNCTSTNSSFPNKKENHFFSYFFVTLGLQKNKNKWRILKNGVRQPKCKKIKIRDESWQHLSLYLWLPLFFIWQRSTVFLNYLFHFQSCLSPQSSFTYANNFNTRLLQHIGKMLSKPLLMHPSHIITFS